MGDGFRDRVIEALRSVGPGQVVSYGDLAAQAGRPGAARGAGAVLAAGGLGAGACWWRVVYADGRLAPGHEAEQGRRLRAEGVDVRGGRVVVKAGPSVRGGPGVRDGAGVRSGPRVRDGAGGSP